MRREFSRKIKSAAIKRAAGHCEACKAVLKTGEAQVDHILEDALGGEPILANAQVLCTPCHKAKTAIRVAMIRKADRAGDRHSGAIKPKGSFLRADKPERTTRPTAAGVSEIARRFQCQ